MKKALLCGTALAAAGLVTSQAWADQQLKLGISGFYRGAIGGVIGGDQAHTTFTGAAPPFPRITVGQGDFGRTDTGFRQEIRINFKGDTTFDNGLTVAVLVGLNPEGASNASARLNRAYADFRGKYGDVRFGQANSALLTDCVADPGNVTANFGVNSPNVVFANAAKGVFAGHTFGGGVSTPVTGLTVGVAPLGSIGTCFGIENRGTKIAYFSPSFGGFTFGVSYAPSGSTTNTSGSQGFGAGTDFRNAKASNVLSVGADYSHDFANGLSLLVGGGGEWAFESYTAAGLRLGDKADPSTYLLGVQLAFPDGFSIGASGAWVNNYKQAGYAATDAGSTSDGWVASAGVNYATGPFAIGLEGIYSSWQVVDPFFLAGSTSGHDKIWGTSLNGSYALGPGISLEAQVAYFKYDSAFASSPGFPTSSSFSAIPINYGAVELDTGFAINF